MKPNDLAKILKHCVSTREAADLLAATSPTGSCTTARVAQLAAAGQIAGAVKWGKEWILPRASVLAYSKVERFGGRPPA